MEDVILDNDPIINEELVKIGRKFAQFIMDECNIDQNKGSADNIKMLVGIICASKFIFDLNDICTPDQVTKIVNAIDKGFTIMMPEVQHIRKLKDLKVSKANVN